MHNEPPTGPYWLHTGKCYTAGPGRYSAWNDCRPRLNPAQFKRRTVSEIGQGSRLCTLGQWHPGLLSQAFPHFPSVVMRVTGFLSRAGLMLRCMARLSFHGRGCHSPGDGLTAIALARSPPPALTRLSSLPISLFSRFHKQECLLPDPSARSPHGEDATPGYTLGKETPSVSREDPRHLPAKFLPLTEYARV